MKKVLIPIIILIISLIGVFAIKRVNSTKEEKQNDENEIQEIIQETNENKEVEIFKGKTRPIAVMIDNVGEARPQAGLKDAYMVYEITVEGKLTRMMALFKDVDLEKIGPVRSSRHYFLDYALEHDAIYTHFGTSILAEEDIKELKINNINGLVESSKTFWRVSDKPAPHNVATSTEKLLNVAKRKGYATTSDKDSVLNYVSKNVELENGMNATKVVIPYTNSYKVTYNYDESTGRYTREYNEVAHKDWTTKELLTTKNIIITFAENYDSPGHEISDLQELSNIGSLDGYYITNGKAIKIKCDKDSRAGQTVYKDLQGNEIEVNDGNTFVQIVPLNTNININ